MEAISYNILEDDNIDQILDKVDIELIGNKQFEAQLRSALHRIARKADKIPNVNIYIEDDCRSFSIISGLRSNPDHTEEKLKDNTSYDECTFSLDEYGSMIVEETNGTLFKFMDYYDTYKLIEPYLNKLANGMPRNLISLYHTYKEFDKDGIQMKYDFYTDNIAVSEEFNVNDGPDTIAKLRDIVIFENKPRFDKSYKDEYFFNHYSNPYYLGLRRLPFNLSLADQTLIYGNNLTPHRSIKCVDLENPDLLRVEPIPVIDFDRGINVTVDYANKYPGMSKQEIEKEIAVRFNEELRLSNTREAREEIYERLKARSDRELATRFSEKSEVKSEGKVI